MGRALGWRGVEEQGLGPRARSRWFASVDVEDVVADLGPDRGVAPNHIRQRRALEVGDFRGRKDELIPVAIAISQSFELVPDHGERQLADMSAVERVLRKCPDPQIDVFDVRISRRQARLHVRVGADFGEICSWREAHDLARDVVAGEAVVTTALNVERRQVETTRPRWSEQVISDIIDQLRIDRGTSLAR